MVEHKVEYLERDHEERHGQQHGHDEDLLAVERAEDDQIGDRHGNREGTVGHQQLRESAGVVEEGQKRAGPLQVEADTDAQAVNIDVAIYRARSVADGQMAHQLSVAVDVGSRVDVAAQGLVSVDCEVKGVVAVDDEVVWLRTVDHIAGAGASGVAIALVQAADGEIDIIGHGYGM